MEFKQLTIEQLKEGYMDRHGFIFVGASKCDPKNCSSVAYAVNRTKFTSAMPEFIVPLNDRTFMFVYPSGISFDMPAFLKQANHWTQITQGFQVESMAYWLSEQKSVDEAAV